MTPDIREINAASVVTVYKKFLEGFKKESEKEDQADKADTHEAAGLFRVGELIKDIKVAMLTVRKTDGSLHSCPMMTLGNKFDRTLWFFTAANSCKSHEVEKDSEVNVSYADPLSNCYVSVSGRAKLVHDPARMADLWIPLAKTWFPQGLEDPNLSLLQVTVERAEYWDTAAGMTVVLFQLAKSLLSGRLFHWHGHGFGHGFGTNHELIELETVANHALPEEKLPENVVELDAKNTNEPAPAKPHGNRGQGPGSPRSGSANKPRAGHKRN